MQRKEKEQTTKPISLGVEFTYVQSENFFAKLNVPSELKSTVICINNGVGCFTIS